MIRCIVPVRRQGKSRVITIPKEVASEIGIEFGDRVLLTASKVNESEWPYNQPYIKIIKEEE